MLMQQYHTLVHARMRIMPASAQSCSTSEDHLHLSFIFPRARLLHAPARPRGHDPLLPAIVRRRQGQPTSGNEGSSDDKAASRAQSAVP